MSFLTAEWRKLAIFNYVIDPKILKKYIPAGTELDIWNGKCYVSLIGFLFQETRLKGVKVPFHNSFEEVNLRFYVKCNTKGIWKRGVVFIKEFVPRFALALVANVFYNENYKVLPMDHSWSETYLNREVVYRWYIKGIWQTLAISARKEPLIIEKGSEVHFITEHYWGYAKNSIKKTNEYEVNHPEWRHYKVEGYKVDVDFALNYGESFRFLNYIEPLSVILVEGSEVSVGDVIRMQV
jgi:uncharacterized protein YqjF (DUF2071 family)